MRVHVAFTPGEAVPMDAPLGIVVDVLRATSTISQALASGYERVYCCREVDEARALRDQLGEGLLGGEREAVRIEGFDVGASPREFLGEPRARSVIFSTTNGTRAILETASRADEVLLGSLLNLDAVAAAARERGEDVVIVCAGFQGRFALDDAYCAGRIVQLLGAERSDAAKATDAIASAWPDAHEGLLARTYGPPGLEDDIAFCAQVSALDAVPRLSRMVDGSAEITTR
ncbi:MAG: 2-phosphosulfolactate phosphatase [Actinobacteria bacterium]|nr:MAG: 2-phosphosulfolactate phosphatase [Actinomycetota bacterium]